MRARAAVAVDDVGLGRASGGAQVQVLGRRHVSTPLQHRAPPQPLVPDHVSVVLHLRSHGESAQLAQGQIVRGGHVLIVLLCLICSNCITDFWINIDICGK